jgi:hypothetical protein
MKKLRNIVAGFFALLLIFIASVTPLTNIWWIAMMVLQSLGFALAYLVFLRKKIVQHILFNIKKKNRQKIKVEPLK